MDNTYELRWFGAEGTRHSRAAELRAWVGAQVGEARRPPPIERRMDVYFSVNDADAIGIKLRGGRGPDGTGKLEIKTRVRNEPVPWQAGSVSGLAEEWQKIGMEYTQETQAVLEGALGLSACVERVYVCKERVQWIVQCNGTKLAPAPTRDNGMVRACTLECSRLLVGSTRKAAWRSNQRCFWSFAMEAIDRRPDGSRRDTLLEAFENIFDRYDGDLLTEENSFGYPRYLKSLRSE